MTAGKRKKGFTVKFDLSPAGVLGVGVVCFCIFLWMFLLGVWSGQTTLFSGKQSPDGVGKPQVETLQTQVKKVTLPKNNGAVAPEPIAVPAPVVKKKELAAASEKKSANKARSAPESEEDPAFFAVQVAAFKDSALAAKELKAWQGKGYDSFSRPPEGADDQFTRVYIGHFDNRAAAKKKAALLAEKEKIKPFIVLVPAD